MKKHLFKSFILILFIFCLVSCISIKPHQRIYVNDPEMQTGMDAGKGYENYVHSIRQGATPAGTDKASGGCGCN
jgi:hypothetical protein